MRAVRIISAIAGIAGAAMAGTFVTACGFFDAATTGPRSIDASIPQDGGSPNDGGPLVTSVPDAWQPSKCGGVGNRCAMGCGPAGECQATQDVCVPMAGPNGFPGPSAQTPYCMASTCMTFDQASCFCAGPAGALFSECALGPAAVVGLCATQGSSCVSKSCCGSFKCVKDSPTSGTCYQSCTASTGCGSAEGGCCTDLKGTGDLECAPRAACLNPCTTQGGTCTDSRQCCTGTCVSATTNPDFIGCRPSCTMNADCLSGCCQPFSNSTGGFCVDAHYCSCAPLGADCLYVGCCPGSSCGSFQPDGGPPFRCYQNCMGSVDCDGGCCSANYPGKTYGGCAPNCP